MNRKIKMTDMASDHLADQIKGSLHRTKSAKKSRLAVALILFLVYGGSAYPSLNVWDRINLLIVFVFIAQTLFFDYREIKNLAEIFAMLKYYQDAIDRGLRQFFIMDKKILNNDRYAMTLATISEAMTTKLKLAQLPVICQYVEIDGEYDAVYIVKRKSTPAEELIEAMHKAKRI